MITICPPKTLSTNDAKKGNPTAEIPLYFILQSFYSFGNLSYSSLLNISSVQITGGMSGLVPTARWAKRELADAVGHDENLTSRMGVPCIDDTRLKHHIVQSWRTCLVGSILRVCQSDGTVEGRRCQRRIRSSEHQTVDKRWMVVLLQRQFIVIFVR